MSFLGELVASVIGDVIGEGVREGVTWARLRRRSRRPRRSDGRHMAPEVVFRHVGGELPGLRPSRRGVVGTLDELGRFFRPGTQDVPVELRLLNGTPRELGADERWAPREMVVYSVGTMSGARAELGIFRDETHVVARLIDG